LAAGIAAGADFERPKLAMETCCKMTGKGAVLISGFRDDTVGQTILVFIRAIRG